MFVQLSIVVVVSLIVAVTAEDACDRWKNHRNFHLLPSENVCGKVKINQETSSRVLNGQEAARGSLPWMAYIMTISRRSGEMRCGGSIINENYILTAAHCVDDSTNPIVLVILGLHNQKMLDDGMTEAYNVTKRIIHPTYDKEKHRNDIALLRLGRSINLTSPYINYICLPTSCELARSTFLGEKLTVAGWGYVLYGRPASTLRKVALDVRKCDHYVVKGTQLSHDWSHLCAGSGDFMTCQGDSGCPLMYKTETDGRFVQVGVSSMGPNTDCLVTTDETVKSTFSRVAAYMGWILKTIET